MRRELLRHDVQRTHGVNTRLQRQLQDLAHRPVPAAAPQHRRHSRKTGDCTQAARLEEGEPPHLDRSTAWKRPALEDWCVISAKV